MRERWKELLPVAALVMVLLALGAVVVFGAVGPGVDQSAPTLPPPTSTPTSTPASPGQSGSSAPQTPSQPGSLDPSQLPTLPGCLAPTRLNVLTFNIHTAVGPGGYEPERIAREIAASHADVVLLQEVAQGTPRTGYADEPAWLGKRLGMSVVYAANHRTHGGGRAGTAVLSRYPIQTSRNLRLPRPVGTQQRAALRVSIVVAGQVVDVYSTHLENTSGTARLEQITAIRAMVEADPHAVVLGGDFNARPRSDVLATARSFLRDSWTEVGRGRGLTHSQRRPRMRIDYVFHNDWLTPRAAEVLPTAVSDHRSVWVAFDLWSKAGCGT